MSGWSDILGGSKLSGGTVQLKCNFTNTRVCHLWYTSVPLMGLTSDEHLTLYEFLESNRYMNGTCVTSYSRITCHSFVLVLIISRSINNWCNLFSTITTGIHKYLCISPLTYVSMEQIDYMRMYIPIVVCPY